MRLSDIDFRDIQGLVRFGHAHLKEAHFLLLNIIDVAAARSWLAEAPVTTAVKVELPDHALQVAFTYQGLKKLGASEKILNAFSYEFICGMAEKNRSRRLGDIRANDSKEWKWGSPGKEPHVLVMVYAKTGQLASWETTVKGKFWDAAFSQLECLSTDDIGGIEPFGFADGTSQPALDWDRQKETRLRDTQEYTNVSALGEFLLGYPNEYGKYTDRPLLDPSEDPESILPLADDAPGKKDFGRNGTYLVLRDLSQNVPGFWQFVDKQAMHNPHEGQKIARAMVGRMPPDPPIIPSGYQIVPGDDPYRIIPPGGPVTSLRNDPIDGVGPVLKDVWLNQFTYRNDADGTNCPYGAHIRRANPRNADLPEGTRGWISRLIRILGFGSKSPRDDLIASTRFHRILRRGREYGPLLKPEDAAKAGAKIAERGLRFICLNANISRQFEFVQNSWIANPKFDGLDEADPLLGNRAPFWAGGDTDAFSLSQESGLCRRIKGLPQFVTVQGGAYFFMPGLSALRYLAR
jgi:deferrochelatase/peroxidase EfeB